MYPFLPIIDDDITQTIGKTSLVRLSQLVEKYAVKVDVLIAGVGCKNMLNFSLSAGA
jgi:hypothetical protein